MSGIAITFPSSPVEGQTHLAQNGFTYIYDSQKNRWKRGGEFVRAPKVLSFAGIAASTSGSGITTGPTGALIYNIPGFVIPSSDVGVDSYKAYRAAESYPNYTEIQVSISSAFSTIAYAATSTSTTFTIPAGALSGDTTYYLRARQFVGSNASAASTGAISGYSQNIISFATTSLFLDSPTIVSIAGTTQFPAYQIGFANTTLPATVTYTGSGVGNLQQVEWRVTGPRNPDSTGDTALAEVGIGTFSSATLANALVLAMPFSGATGVGITNDVNNAIRTASGASAGTTKTVTAVGSATTVSVGIATTTAHFYPSAASFNGSSQYLTLTSSSDFAFGTGDFTIEGWIYPLAFNSYNTLASTRTALGTVSGFNLSVNSSGQLILYTNGFLITATASVFLRTWTHFAFVRKSNILNVYSNGILVGSTTITNDFTRDTFWIASTDGTEPFNGYFQDFKVYKGLAKYQENFTPPLPTYGTISYTTRTIGSVGVATTAFFESTGDIPTAEVAIGSSTAAQVASSLVLAMPMNRTFGFQDINVAVRGLTSGASAGTAKTVGLGTTSTANAPSHPRISVSESKWYDGAAYFDGGDYLSVGTSNDYLFGTGDFTIESWFYLTTNASRQDLCGNYSGASTGWGVALGDASSNGMYFYYGNTTYATTSAGLWSTNTWNHIALSRQSGTLSIYLNGNRVSSASATVDVSTTSYSTLIGAVTNTSGNPQLYCTGYLQDFKIYKGFAKYTANFTPPRPICGFTTDLAIQTGFTTTSATGVALTSIVGLGSTSTLAFAADQTYAGITSITSSSGITTLPDPYAQNLVFALPLANITGAGNSFTNDRNTQIRSVSITGAGVTAGTTKTITNNSGVSTVSISTVRTYNNVAYFSGSNYLSASDNDLALSSGDFTVECWIYAITSNDDGIYESRLVDGNATGFTITALNSTTIRTYSNGVLISATVPNYINKWTHVSVCRRQSTTRLYVDGLLVGSAVDNTNYSDNRAFVGSGVWAGSGFNGYISDFRIYKGAAKYQENFTPPPPMFGDYTRSTPNKIVFTPGSDYVLEARNTATGGIVTSTYSATRQWGTKPKGGIYDPFASNLVLAIPGGAVGGATTTFDVTGQIRFETPTASYVNAGIVTYSNSLGIGTYGNKSVTNTGPVSISSTITKYYSRSMQLTGVGGIYLTAPSSSDFAVGTGDFTFECWVYCSNLGGGALCGLFNIGQFSSGLLFRLSNTYGYEIYVNGSTTNSSSSVTPPERRWFHVALVRQNGVMYVYEDGVRRYQTTLSGSIGQNSVTIGVAAHALPTEGLNGYMTDVRFYKGLAKYTSNFTPPNQIFLT